MKRLCITALYALGLIGGLGWTLYNHAWLIAAGVAALGVLAFPTLKKVWSDE